MSVAALMDGLKLFTTAAGTAKSAKSEDSVGIGLGSAAFAGQIGYTYAKHGKGISEATKKKVKDGAWIIDLALALIAVQEIILLNGGIGSGTASPDKFKLGQEEFDDVADLFVDAIPAAEDWSGEAADAYAAANAVALACAQTMAAGDTALAAILKKEGTEISQTRQWVLDTKLGLIAMIPVAIAIYSSGPTGAIYSQVFQTIVAMNALGFVATTFILQSNSSSDNAMAAKEAITTYYKKVITDANSTAQSVAYDSSTLNNSGI